MRVLVTGGAGFVGSHLCDELIRRGHRVRVYDALDRQVHPRGRVPAYLTDEVEFVHGDVRDRDRVKKAMEGMEVLFHQAAYVGVGQSMYEIRRYVDGNSVGGATVLDVLANEKHSIGRVIVASSMSIYGEGCYRCDACEGLVAPDLRSRAQMAAHEWELRCPDCSAIARPVGTPEEKPLRPTSIYAVTKRDHEEMFLSVGQAYGIPTVALRYFNIYGSRQALSNPYTGVMAIFSGRLLGGNAPVVYEDGKQTRDFVHVSDIVQANMLAMEKKEADYGVFNVGTGRATSVLDVANMLMDHLDMHVTPDVRKQFREGDIRHCFADVSRIRTKLGYEPKVRLEDGLEELVEWVREQTAEDTFENAAKELQRHGLLR
jgi:dTDP-L-rhamnose 4-epimerase